MLVYVHAHSQSFSIAQPSTHCLMLLGPNLAKWAVQAGKYKSVVQALCFVVAFEASHDLKQPHLLHSTQQSTQQMRSQCRKSSCAISSLCILPIVTTSWWHHGCEHILSGEYISLTCVASCLGLHYTGFVAYSQDLMMTSLLLHRNNDNVITHSCYSTECTKRTSSTQQKLWWRTENEATWMYITRVVICVWCNTNHTNNRTFSQILSLRFWVVCFAILALSPIIAKVILTLTVKRNNTFCSCFCSCLREFPPCPLHDFPASSAPQWMIY